MTQHYVNRYNDEFSFTYDEKNSTILWEGDFEYVRYGWETNVTPEENRFNMVDPSGGPYISSGRQSDLIMDGVKGFYVDYISGNLAEPGKFKSFNIHLKPLNK